MNGAAASADLYDEKRALECEYLHVENGWTDKLPIMASSNSGAP
jgi:hypothetical protein